MTRQEFMDYYRSEAFDTELTPDDCQEIFLGCLKGQHDLTLNLLNQLCDSYDTTLQSVLESGEVN